MMIYYQGVLLMAAVVFAAHTTAEQVCTNLKNFLSQRKNGWTPAPLSRVKSCDGLLSCVKNCTVLPDCRSYRFLTTENTCILLDQYEKQLDVQDPTGEFGLTKTKKPHSDRKHIKLCTGEDHMYLARSKTCVTLYKKRKTWMQAKDFCHHVNGTLVVIKTRQKQRAIVNLVKNTKADYIWIGARLSPETNKFLWNDGSTMKYFSAWNFGEPSTYMNALFGLNNNPEECVQLWKSENCRWNDGYCSTQEFFLCEANLAPRFSKQA